MHIECHADTALSERARFELASYRHEVFVERLGWDLPCQPGLDQDQFDLPQAVHLAARADDGHLIGYARLLPTTGRYLLAELFPDLLGQQAAPQDAAVWELSRYAAMDTHGSGNASDELFVGKQVLLRAILTAAGSGAERLVFCTSVAIERLAMRWGVDIHRMAPPVRHGRQLLVAAVIEFSEQTLRALSNRDSLALSAAAVAIPRAASAPAVIRLT
ncbi:acyl-homoserine-lactone synthase [Paucibacter sp. DJ2R-2]|uniref:acyl-homoserine-lactone synthase n=1 Tax=Paucibacter sp. DJ2R-2 TaxID=2893558 RepID=UPI0021E44B4C|nr:acyl-homoserine-lactone synthase [Paucibacter sp. DJ2R-2]MCV2419327.1 GNAT family N-acetyltransferase [Paucibacter sp. DJ4R-1]MCV2437769.1 GNAT family N-acetyltransferase [Paucibacter sp. DJ2R-2]